MSDKRLLELDILRVLALIGMIVFHIVFILDFYQVIDVNFYSGFWLFEGQVVRIIFLSLVGVNLAISRKKYTLAPKTYYLRQWERALIILFYALTITLITALVIPQNFVKFGILHFIASSIFILSFFAEKKYLALLIGLISLYIGFRLEDFTTDSLALFILGIKAEHFSTIDYFPIFPWLAYAAFGIFIGNSLYPQNRPLIHGNFDSRFFCALSCLSKNSLIIYILHVPIVISILLIFGIIPLRAVF